MPLDGDGCCSCDDGVDDVALEDWLEEGNPLQLPISPFSLFFFLLFFCLQSQTVVDSGIQ